MHVKLEKSYPLAVDAEAAWTLLSDIREMAGCMPGATIHEQVDATHYKGTVKVKLGPASAAFAGDIEVLGVDAATRTVRLRGKGADRGGSNASMDLAATVQPAGPGASALTGTADMAVTGKLAQFGGRMMTQVADMILAQYVQNFAAKAAALQPAEAASGVVGAGSASTAGAAGAAGAAGTAGAEGAAGTTEAAEAAGSGGVAGSGGLGGAARAPRAAIAGTDERALAEEAATIVSSLAASPLDGAAAGGAGTRPAGPAPAGVAPSGKASASAGGQPAPSTELNGLAIAWALIKGWFARLFRRGG